jgi:1,4-alpha-glucan branching enzyme
MNQQDIPNPYVLMYYDFDAGKPAANNPWFNQEATHPFNVFFDLNHESTYTQAYLDTVNYYWLHEYKFDGYRFDLSKGFTQKNAGGSVSAWGQYDASRIAILKRMADKIWSHTPDAYVILEHFADNDEEKELAEYRVAEGKV